LPVDGAASIERGGTNSKSPPVIVGGGVVIEPSTPDLIEFLLQALGRNRRVAATRTGEFILAEGLTIPLCLA
jgi:transcriptional regulator GlxA family with amidase domain